MLGSGLAVLHAAGSAGTVARARPAAHSSSKGTASGEPVTVREIGVGDSNTVTNPVVVS
jgi:hypothetical protein